MARKRKRVPPRPVSAELAVFLEDEAREAEAWAELVRRHAELGCLRRRRGERVH